MKMLAVPVPLFDANMGVEAYSFRFQKGDNSFSGGQSYSFLDGVTDSPLLDIINQIGLEALTLGKPIFSPVSHITLLSDLSERCSEQPSNIVFTIDKNFPIEDAFIDRVLSYKEMGYRFACNSKMNWTAHKPLFRMCDYMFINMKTTDPRQARDYLKSVNPNIKIIVSHVETAEMFESVRYGNFELFEGAFYRLPVTKGQNEVSPLKINYVRLLNVVRDENFEIDKVAEIVQQDTALAISLLQMVNSLGLYAQITSINHASAMLGQNELRKWITMAVTKMLSADKPNEITKLSLVRAKFAENLAVKFEMAINAQSLFLMGLFSAVDIILDVPMEQALTAVHVSDTIRKALVSKSGPFYKVLEFVLDYENGDWVSVSRALILNNLNVEDVSSAYFGALSWYSDLVAEGAKH